MKKRRKAKAKARHESSQRMLWRLCIWLSLAIFLAIAAWLVAAEFGLMARPDAATEEFLEYADLAAILVFAIELYKRYRKSESKMEFLRKNWVEILLLLPIGMAFRAFRSLEAFRGLEILGEAKVGSRLMEADGVMTGFALTGKSAAKAAAKAHGWARHFDSFRSAGEKLKGIIKGIAG